MGRSPKKLPWVSDALVRETKQALVLGLGIFDMAVTTVDLWFMAQLF